MSRWGDAIHEAYVSILHFHRAGRNLSVCIANGISIPSSYTAYLAPLSSSKLFQEARTHGDQKGAETPYVVMFQSVNILSGDGAGASGRCQGQIQACWEFVHPRPDVVVDSRGQFFPPPGRYTCLRPPSGLPLTNTHNVRSTSLTFHVPDAGVMHGMAGYFEAALYGGVQISIHPHRKDLSSKDMLSWFPLFFPLRVCLSFLHHSLPPSYLSRNRSTFRTTPR
jgi:type II protein arginine methyltransferase